MAEELRGSLNIEAKLIPGSNGMFDVIVDGQLLFSKSQTGRFPNRGEISEKLKQF